jgi:hypothetical protein
MDWVAACRVASRAPVLDYLRFLDELPELSADEAAKVMERIDDDDDRSSASGRRWVGPALARLSPVAHWRILLDQQVGPMPWTTQALFETLGDRVVALLDDPPGRPARVLSLLEFGDWEPTTVPPRVAAAWPQILALTTHPDVAARFGAARIAARGRQVNPSVLELLGQQLARVDADEGDGGYDAQVDGEELLSTIARAGPRLSALSPALARILTCTVSAFRAAAAHAAGSLGGRPLRSTLELAEGRTPEGDFEQQIERALHRYAIWQLGGDDAWFGKAIDDASPSMVSVFRLDSAFATTAVDARLLAALATVAAHEAWTATVYQRFAAIGPPAAPTVAALVVPEIDASDGISHAKARWKTGLDTAAMFAERLEPLLGSSWAVWTPYLETDLGTPAWCAAIRRAIAHLPPNALGSGIGDAVRSAPGIGARFLPDLVAHRQDALVESLHRALPRETFWAAV